MHGGGGYGGMRLKRALQLDRNVLLNNRQRNKGAITGDGKKTRSEKKERMDTPLF